MSAMFRALMCAAAIGSVACGATTSDPGPITTPRTTSTVTTEPSGPVDVASDRFGTVPAGTELDVRLQSTLSSESSTVEQRFEATTAVDVRDGRTMLIPAGALVRGVVSGVEKAGRLERTGSLTLSFDRMTVNGREHDIRATATQIFESRGIRDEAGTAGAGAGVGGIIGGILGGVKGAILGAAIGAGGAIAATDGKDITLPAGSIVRIRLDTPVSVR